MLSRLDISEGFSFPVPQDTHDVPPVIDGHGSRPAVNIHDKLAIEGLSSLSLGSSAEPIQQGFSCTGIQGWCCQVNKEINCLFLCINIFL